MRTNHLTQCLPDLPFDPSPNCGQSPPGACFAWGIVLTLFMLAAALTPHAAKAGSITYAIQNYPADQNGHTVSGSITTDGKTGLLDTTDITSWVVTIDTTTFRSTDPNSSTAAIGVFATPTEIKIPGFGGGLLLETDLQFGSDTISWVRVPLDADLSNYAGRLQTDNLWNTFNPALGGTNPWILASVPEPSSVVLAGIGAVASIASVLVRRCRAQRGDGGD
jgi:PEP-CTERM motif